MLRARIAKFPGPASPLGEGEMWLEWLAGWQKTPHPRLSRPLSAVFVGSHEVARYISAIDPVNAAKARIESLASGSVVVRGAAEAVGAAFKVYEMGSEYPAADFREADSLSQRECAAAMAYGMEVVAEGADIIALGCAGCGAATAATAIARALYGGAVEYWVGGQGDEAQRRADIVRNGNRFHRDYLSDPMEVLCRFGGRDIAGLVGAIVAARHQCIPVVLDGFIVTIAAAILHHIKPDAISHCMAGHISAEPAHGALLERLNLTPILTTKIGVGDGTGATLSLGLLRSVVQGLETIDV